MRKRFKTSESRQKILLAALKCCAKHGYHGTSVRDICAGAKMNVCAVNYHFGSKEQLWQAVCEYTSDSLKHIITESMDFKKPPAEAVPEFVDALVDALLEQPELLRIVSWINREADTFDDYETTKTQFQPLEKLGLEYLNIQVRKGNIRPDLNYEAILTMLNTIVVFAFVNRKGSVYFSGRKMTVPGNVAMAKSEITRAAVLMLGIDKSDTHISQMPVKNVKKKAKAGRKRKKVISKI